MSSHTTSAAASQDADALAEQRYFEEAYEACRDYMTYHLSANHLRRMNLLTLPKAQRELLVSIGFKDKLDAVDEGIRQNAEFLEDIAGSSSLPFGHNQEPLQNLVAVVTDDPSSSPSSGSHNHQHDHGHNHAHHHEHSHDQTAKPKKSATKHQAARDHSQEKIRSTLRQMVRDWSEEGQVERDACYKPCIEALEKHYEALSREKGSSVKVLVPGAGLGRLPLELAARGFVAQGNEFSAHMLIASNWCLNESNADQPYQIFPYLHSFSNHLTTSTSVLKSVFVPDVSPSSLISPGSDFSFVAGDFLEVYGGISHDRSSGIHVPDEHRGQWGSVITCFFIDTARNIIDYLQTIYELLDDEGVWINIGPLLWHFENVMDKERGEGSLELSLDEVVALAKKIGFEIKEHRIIKTTYAGHQESMLRSEYQAAFWTATKRPPSTS